MNNESVTPREPWLAANLSIFFAGIGEIYCRRKQLGFILILVQLSLIAISIFLIISFSQYSKFAYLSILLFVIVYFSSIYHAYVCAKESNTSEFEIQRKADKAPWLAVFLSRILPGIGHFYVRKWYWGIPIILILISLSMFTYLYPLWSRVVLALFSGVVSFHAYTIAPIRRESSEIPIMVLSIVIAIVGFTVSYSFGLLGPYKIPSGAMIPTLLVGDHILVKKGVDDVHRGDVVAFWYPNNEHEPSKTGLHYIKRVVGLPGDKVDVDGRNLTINGEEVPLTFVGTYQDERFGTKYDKYQEDLLGKKHIVIYEQGREYTQRGNLPVVVPPGHVFVMGDNRDNSQDSRFWGFVPINYIVGKAFVIHWSWDFDTNNILNRVRWDRLITPIK